MAQSTTSQKNICMIVPDPLVRGGIAAVTSGYYGSRLESDYNITYIQSYRDGGKLTKLLKGICSYIQFVYVLSTKHIDAIHIHSSFGPSFYRKLPFIQIAHSLKIPIINHIHGAEFGPFYSDASPAKQAKVRKAYGKCSVLIALSDEWKDKLSTIVDSDKIKVLPNYSTLHEDALDKRLNPNNNLKNSINILFLGELGHRKGTFDIPDIAKKLSQKLESNCVQTSSYSNPKFILAGSGSDEDEKSLRSKISSLDLDDMFSLPGWIRDKEKDDLLRSSDIFLLPSYNEGMPMSILDACGYGLPIVSTCVGGIPQIVHDGESGFLCVPGDINSFADALYKLVTDSTLLQNMSKASYRLVQDSYSLDSHISMLESIYQYCLDTNP